MTLVAVEDTMVNQSCAVQSGIECHLYPGRICNGWSQRHDRREIHIRKIGILRNNYLNRIKYEILSEIYFISYA